MISCKDSKVINNLLFAGSIDPTGTLLLGLAVVSETLDVLVLFNPLVARGINHTNSV